MHNILWRSTSHVCDATRVAIVVDMLGRRLEMESDGQLASDAHLCYIVSGNTEQLVTSWDKVLADSATNDTLQVSVYLVLLNYYYYYYY